MKPRRLTFILCITLHKVPMPSKYFLVNQNYTIAGFLWFFGITAANNEEGWDCLGTGQDMDQHLEWQNQVKYPGHHE